MRPWQSVNNLLTNARLLTLLLASVLAAPTQAALSLEEAVVMAQHNDPWLAGSEYRQAALAAQRTVAGTLPDPVVSVGLVNMPSDSFEFDQEAMTQFKVGVSQLFPRGDSRALNQKRLSQLGAQHPLQREERLARVALSAAHLWLEAFRAQQTIQLIQRDRALFEQLVDVAQSSYASAMGRTRQQDLVRAQLELTRLDDRLAVLQQQRETSLASLGEWLYSDPAGPTQFGAGLQADVRLAPDLPPLQLSRPELYHPSAPISSSQMAQALRRHPALLGLDRKIAAGETTVELAEQKYKPQWSVNASYGYREDEPGGDDRADFFSVGVAFDLPLFTSRRQDQQVQAALAGSAALRTEKALLLRRMVAAYAAQYRKLQRLEQRSSLYQSRLLREMQEQTEASLSAYTADDGDFSEVVRARIDALNARLDAFDIEVDRLKTVAQMNYFLVTSAASEAGDAL